MRKFILATLCLSTTACVTAPPDEIFLNYDHNSHVLSGRPFESQKGSEDWIDAVGITARWNYRTIFYEAGVQYNLFDSGYAGSPVLFNGRIAVKIHSKE